MANTTSADAAWTLFALVVKGFIPSQEEKIAQAWAEMAKHSSRKDLMLQKQNNLKARMRCI